MDEQIKNADLHGNKWCSKFWYCMFSAQDERLPGVKHCLHNLYKYLFFLYLSYFGVIMYSRVKRWTPTHLWNARSAFLCRTSCIPRKEAGEKGSISQWHRRSGSVWQMQNSSPKSYIPLDSKQHMLCPAPGTAEDRKRSPCQPKTLALAGPNWGTMPGESVSWMVTLGGPRHRGPSSKTSWELQRGAHLFSQV